MRKNELWRLLANMKKFQFCAFLSVLYKFLGLGFGVV
jgi:hypothetical protein